MGKFGPLERAQLANQIQGFRIPDLSDAWENNKNWYSFMHAQVELSSENLWKCSESVGAIQRDCFRHFHKKLYVNAFTSPHRLVFHSGHSLSSHRSVVGGFVLVSQLISLSLHSNERVLTPEPQVTEHCKKEKDNQLYKSLLERRYQIDHTSGHMRCWKL